MARCEFCGNPVRFWLDAPDRCAFCGAPLGLAVSVIPYDWEHPNMTRLTLWYQGDKAIGSVAIDLYHQWEPKSPNMRDQAMIAFYECLKPDNEKAREKYRFKEGR